MLKSLFSFLKRIDSVSAILHRKSISPEVLFLYQKGAVMLTMIVLLVLLYALNGSFAVPTVCFVLSWIGIGFGAFDLILKLFLKAYEKHLD